MFINAKLLKLNKIDYAIFVSKYFVKIRKNRFKTDQTDCTQFSKIIANGSGPGLEYTQIFFNSDQITYLIPAEI